jgi:hypothetical protein
MRQYKNLLVVAFFTALLSFFSCKKKDYLTDGGVHDAKTSMNTYDYLKSNQYKLFDTFLLVVDKFNLKSELLNAKTVFAVTDYSIARYMSLKQTLLRQINENWVYTLDSLYKDMSADSVRQYFFDEKLTLGDAVVEPEVKQVKSRGNTSCGVSKRQFTVLELNGNDGGLPTWTNSPIYGLYYTKIRGALDVPGTTPPANEIDIKVLCQTTGILPVSDKGTYDQVLHVLANTHTFIRF